MYKLTQGTFIKELQKAKTEEEVKFAYVKEFKIKFSAAYKQDLYTLLIFSPYRLVSHQPKQNILLQL